LSCIFSLKTAILLPQIVDIVQRALDEHFPLDSDLPVEVIAEPVCFLMTSNSGEMINEAFYRVASLAPPRFRCVPM